jgi:amino acid adenylation domain-containing protein
MSQSELAPPHADTPFGGDADADEVFAFPASFAQQRLWFLEQLEPSSAAYNIPVAVRLRGRLNRDALTRALNEVVRRHEALRTTFATSDNQPVQVIADHRPRPLPLIDLCGLGPRERAAEAQRLSDAEARRPFDLSRGPLLRASLLRLGEREHVALLTLHHIISDRWSCSVLLRELTTLYEAFCGGRESPLSELPIQYADFALWQREWLRGDVLREQLDYWKGQLKDAPALLDLPLDRPRPPAQTFGGAKHCFLLSETLSRRLKALSREEGATVFMVLLAAFQILLWRYSGQSDISVGTPIAGRNRSETEGLIGLFINTVVVRTRLSGGLSFREVLGRVRESSLDAYAHQEMPFEKLVEELRVERRLSQTPLFQVMFMMQNTPREELTLAGLKFEVMESDAGAAKFDLTLSMGEEDGLRLDGGLSYNTDLFEAATIERLAGHFETLLESIVGDPGRRISELQMLDEAERRRLLHEWNDTRADYPRDACLHQLFEQQAALTPDSVALSFGGAQLTYAELDRRANQMARYLRGMGVVAEDRVGVLLERSVEMVVALLGVLKAGAAYVPLDPQYPQTRLAFMLADAGIKLLLTQEELLQVLPEHEARAVCVDADRALVAEQSALPLGRLASADNLAYVIYTSGSTGRPKGVQVAHRQLVNFICSMQKRPGLKPEDRMLALTTLSFDIAALELYLPLCTGAQVVLCGREAAMDGAELARLLRRREVTSMQATPTSWRMLIESGWEGGGGLKALCGGEALTPELAERLRGRCAELWNMYGPTETTVWSAVGEVAGGASRVTLGRAVDNTELYVLDEWMRLAPVGVRGELYVGGEGLARGYLNRPALTAERFVPDPFGARPGARLYRTGDIARRLPGGEIEFFGRADDQVKVRGFRIELGEVEAVLSQHAGVRECVVVAQDVGDGQKRLVGYVVAEAGAEVGAAELRQHLAEKLPDYMLPSAFVMLDEFPLTPNGKLDRRRLPAPDNARPELARQYVEPSNLLEEELAKIWSGLLGVERVGVYDDFFELGGHSLLAMQLISRVRADYDLEIPLRDFFRAPTLKSLAEVIDAAFLASAGEGEDEEMLRQLESIEEEEARGMLARGGGEVPRGAGRADVVGEMSDLP